MCFVSANVQFSVDSLLFKKKSTTIPFWQILIFRFQVVWVYFCAGLVKFNGDWLSGKNLSSTIYESTEFAKRTFFHTDFFVYFFTYSGLLFDLFIGWMLLYKKTRLIAVVLLVAFHLTNAITLKIGIFPYLMILITLLFFPPQKVRDWLGLEKVQLPTRMMKMPAFFIIIFYIFVQLLLPFRHYLIKGNVDWTGEGMMFSWRMKSANKVPNMGQFVINMYDRETDQIIEPKKDQVQLNIMQIIFLMYQPSLFLQMKDQIFKDLNRDEANTIVLLDIECALNGDPFAPIIEKNVDISALKPKILRHNTFITLDDMH